MFTPPPASGNHQRGAGDGFVNNMRRRLPGLRFVLHLQQRPWFRRLQNQGAAPVRRVDVELGGHRFRAPALERSEKKERIAPDNRCYPYHTTSVGRVLGGSAHAELGDQIQHQENGNRSQQCLDASVTHETASS